MIMAVDIGIAEPATSRIRADFSRDRPRTPGKSLCLLFKGVELPGGSHLNNKLLSMQFAQIVD